MIFDWMMVHRLLTSRLILFTFKVLIENLMCIFSFLLLQIVSEYQLPAIGVSIEVGRVTNC